MLTESLIPTPNEGKNHRNCGRASAREGRDSEESVLLSTRQHDMSAFAFVPALNGISKAV